jgi:citrate lyase subunit beta/citryl-CoA lyase
MIMEKASAGHLGDKVRSDCFIEIEKKTKGSIEITLESKVIALYRDAILFQAEEILDFFDIKNAIVTIKDYGALPFTLAARMETAIKRLFPEIKKEFLLPFNKKKLIGTTKDRLRRSRLYLPGNEPKFFVNAGLHSPDGIILDLEDSVSPNEKDSAQLLVRNALITVDFYGCERMVRINQLPKGLDDLKYIIPNGVDVVLVPKVETAEQIRNVENEINSLKVEYKIKNEIFLMPIIESALGVENAFQIASSSDLVCSIAIGLEDFTADLGIERTKAGTESFSMRCRIVNAAKAAKVQAIDTVFSDISDMEGLRESVIEAKHLGFEGKGCIHPRQIPVINEAFQPTKEEIAKAEKIVAAYNDALAKGSGVVALGSKMIDAPVVTRALKVINMVKSGDKK